MDFYYPKIANYFCVHIPILVFLNFKIPYKTAISNLMTNQTKQKYFQCIQNQFFKYQWVLAVFLKEHRKVK